MLGRKRVLLALTVAVVGLFLLGFAFGAFHHRQWAANTSIELVKYWSVPANWPYFGDVPQLPTLNMDMSFRNLTRIEAKRTEAIQQDILLTSADDFVPAKITLDGATVRVRTRLKGDQVDHFRGDKWSFRVEVKGGDHIFGMRRFSIQHPVTRNYLFEWAFLEHLRSEGILAPRYQFVNLVFNGDQRGIFALEEHFSKELLESQGRREGVIIKFDESPTWERRARTGGLHGNVFDASRAAIVDAFRDGRIEKSPVLIAQRDSAIGLLRGYQEGTLAASEVFDPELMGRFLAISELWGAEHGLVWHNLRFYYNPITGRLEPIGFDAEPGSELFQRLIVGTNLPPGVLDDWLIQRAYVQELVRLSTPEYFDHLKQLLEPEHDELKKALEREFKSLKTPWENLQNRQTLISNSLDPIVTVLAFGDAERAGDAEAQGFVEVKVRNPLVLAVAVRGFQIGDKTLIPATEAISELDTESPILMSLSPVVLRRVDPLTVPPQTAEYLSFRIPVDTDILPNDREIKVIARILGAPEWHASAVTAYPSAFTTELLPKRPTIDEALEAHTFLEWDDTAGTLQVQRGQWKVYGDLILPAGVKLETGPGTTLLFEPGAVFYASGPLEFHGTPEQPILLGPQDNSWGGVVVLSAGATSTWNRVNVRATTAIERDGWFLTGGVTFYESPVVLRECRIIESQAEDALNIVRSNFDIRSCEFGEATSDAFDGDFASGRISGSSFHDVGGDAIDVAGSVVEITDVRVSRIGDKGISAGEASNLVVSDYRAQGVGIAIASKDRSTVVGQGITIIGAKHAGLAAYIKKPEYGPGSLTADGASFEDTPRETIVGPSSLILLNGTHVVGTDLDVNALYEAGILGN